LPYAAGHKCLNVSPQRTPRAQRVILLLATESTEPIEKNYMPKRIKKLKRMLTQFSIIPFSHFSIIPSFLFYHSTISPYTLSTCLLITPLSNCSTIIRPAPCPSLPAQPFPHYSTIFLIFHHSSIPYFSIFARRARVYPLPQSACPKVLLYKIRGTNFSYYVTHQAMMHYIIKISQS